MRPPRWATATFEFTRTSTPSRHHPLCLKAGLPCHNFNAEDPVQRKP